MLHAVREELDVVYGHAGGEDLQLDLFAPKDVEGPFPAVVILHGGGWTKGTHEFFRPLAGALAARGYVAASVGYRMAPRHRFPSQIQDVKCAVRWLRANAERFRIDRERIAALGFSAGGHLALLLGLTQDKDEFEGDGGNREQSSRVQAVINISGPTDLTRPEWPEVTRTVFFDLLGGSREQLADAYRTASPITYVHRGAPPVLTIHGTSDPVVPYEQAQLLHAALRKAKVSSRLIPLHGKNHGENWTLKEHQRIATAILDFLDANTNMFYPFLEMSWFHYTRGGDAHIPGFGFEGLDLVNFGSKNVGGRDFLGISPGLRFKLNEHIQAGAAVTWPLLKQKEINDYTLTFDIIFRY
jgi:acetyl esterase/lipase